MMSHTLPRLLIIDDDESVLLAARIALRSHFGAIDTLPSASGLFDNPDRESYDVVLLDMNFTAGSTSGAEGLAILQQLKVLFPSSRIVLMTAYGDIALAVKAMKNGAFDFVVKPWNNDALEAIVLAAARQPGLPPFEKAAHEPVVLPVGLASPAMRQVELLIEKGAPTDANILITGESGTGKGVIAQAIHQLSARKGAPLVHVDLGAVAPTLFESELFGHEKGAFTDAHSKKPGRIEMAAGGTLFLDEIGNLPPALQHKLLTTLQSRSITRLGSNKPTPVDFRLVCATNTNLRKKTDLKEFREDLYFRINTITIDLPPLRERVEEIPVLANHFIDHYSNLYKKPKLHPSQQFLRSLASYDWPGNIRELQHVIERAVILAETDTLTECNLHLQDSAAATGSTTDGLSLESLEREAIRQALLRNNGNLTQAARELGLGRTTLYRKMERYGL